MNYLYIARTIIVLLYIMPAMLLFPAHFGAVSSTIFMFLTVERSKIMKMPGNFIIGLQ